MSERSLSLKTLFTKSLLVFPKNKPLFFSIFAFLVLPLSLFHLAVSLTTLPTRRHVFKLESLARFSHTRFEARQVWQESRDDALSLLSLKLLLLLPSLSLSLLSAVFSVVSAAHISTHSVKKHCFSKPIWVNTLITSFFVYTIMFMYSSGVNVLLAGSNRSGLGILVWVCGLSFEVYLMGVMGLGLVGSILENRIGVEAVRVGWEIMEGNRVCGWVVSGGLMVLTWLIGWGMEGLAEMEGGDDYGSVKRTVAMRGREMMGLVLGYASVVAFGYVIFTVFYCECRKRHVGREGGEVGSGEDDGEEIKDSLGVIL